MTLIDIIKNCGDKWNALSIYKTRCIADKYVELVLYNKEIERWNKIFTDIFGPAIKPAGAKPTDNDLVLTKDYGGVYTHQTLYKKQFNNSTVIAMLWPWQNDIFTSLRIFLLKDIITPAIK